MSGIVEPTAPVTVCELVCPHCGARHRRVMPTDACIWFFECTACGTMLKPKSGDCCVFCSYGSVPCPPVQIACASGDPADVCCR